MSLKVTMSTRITSITAWMTGLPTLEEIGIQTITENRKKTNSFNGDFYRLTWVSWHQKCTIRIHLMAAGTGTGVQRHLT